MQRYKVFPTPRGSSFSSCLLSSPSILPSFLSSFLGELCLSVGSHAEISVLRAFKSPVIADQPRPGLVNRDRGGCHGDARCSAGAATSKHSQSYWLLLVSVGRRVRNVRQTFFLTAIIKATAADKQRSQSLHPSSHQHQGLVCFFSFRKPECDRCRGLSRKCQK